MIASSTHSLPHFRFSESFRPASASNIVLPGRLAESDAAVSKLNGFSPNDCNILLLGFNGDGKSLFFNHLFGEFVAPVNTETTETNFATEYAVETHVGESQTHYVLSLIDTPGIYRSMQGSSKVIYHIQRYWDQSKKQHRLIDVVLIVIAGDNSRHLVRQSRYTQVMKIVRTFFGAAERMPVLLI